MFYIDKRPRSRRPAFLEVHLAPTAIVFLAFASLCVWSWHAANRTIEESLRQQLNRTTTAINSTISQRMSTYEDILRAGAGFFESSDFVSRAEWQQFTSAFDLEHRYRGVQALGYIPLVDDSELATYEQQVQDEGFPEFTSFPDVEANEYAPITYIEPFNTDNKRAFGYNVLSHPTRREAARLARDRGEPTLSHRLTLLQDDSTTRVPGFHMYMPIYATGAPHETLAERRENILGYVYAPFRAPDLFGATLSENDPNFAFQIYDREDLLYESSDFKKISQASDEGTVTQDVKINNVTWKLVGKMRVNAVSETERNRPGSIMFGGSLFTLTLTGFIYLLLLNRSRALADKEDREIQEAKDELLALASHQLRTPATGVKQYVGMVLQGYAGKLKPEQERLLDKAFESNERQLATINEMLFIARADTGNLSFTPERFNIRGVLYDIVSEQAEAVREREQTVKLNLPKKPVYITGDLQYLRMAMENILNNASKYTHGGGKITISLKQEPNQVTLKVQDNGVGVDKSDFPLLFRKFSRIPNELTSKVQGSGIGLYLAQKIINQHGGEIEFTSTSGKGTVVLIKLPRGPGRQSSEGRT